MNRRHLLASIIGIVSIGSMTVLADTQTESGSFNITWSQIASGGGESSGGDFSMSGTIGQATAGEMSGGEFSASGGFWPGQGDDVEPSCAGDCAAGGDGVVNTADLLQMLADWGNPSPCDLDGSGAIDTADLLALLSAWGICE